MSTQGTQGKGRPTPKRKDSVRPRQPITAAPRTRKEALARARELRKEQIASNRTALKSGNVRELPARERTPERILARDFIDARRSPSVLFFPAVIVLFIFNFVGQKTVFANVASVLWLVGIAIMLTDAVAISRGLTPLLKERVPALTKRRNTIFYAVSRATLIRRFRLPKPRIGVGDPIPK